MFGVTYLVRAGGEYDRRRTATAATHPARVIDRVMSARSRSCRGIRNWAIRRSDSFSSARSGGAGRGSARLLKRGAPAAARELSSSEAPPTLRPRARAVTRAIPTATDLPNDARSAGLLVPALSSADGSVSSVPAAPGFLSSRIRRQCAMVMTKHMPNIATATAIDTATSGFIRRAAHGRARGSRASAASRRAGSSANFAANFVILRRTTSCCRCKSWLCRDGQTRGCSSSRRRRGRLRTPPATARRELAQQESRRPRAALTLPACLSVRTTVPAHTMHIRCGAPCGPKGFSPRKALAASGPMAGSRVGRPGMARSTRVAASPLPAGLKERVRGSGRPRLAAQHTPALPAAGRRRPTPLHAPRRLPPLRPC